LSDPGLLAVVFLKFFATAVSSIENAGDMGNVSLRTPVCAVKP